MNNQRPCFLVEIMDHHAGVLLQNLPKWGLGSMVVRGECSSRTPSTFYHLASLSKGMILRVYLAHIRGRYQPEERFVELLSPE